MPAAQLTTADGKSDSKKRKRTGVVEKSQKDGSKKVVKPKPSAEDVLGLEEAIGESPQNYNKIVTLLEYVQVCVCVCVSFSRVCSANHDSP